MLYLTTEDLPDRRTYPAAGLCQAHSFQTKTSEASSTPTNGRLHAIWPLRARVGKTPVIILATHPHGERYGSQ